MALATSSWLLDIFVLFAALLGTAYVYFRHQFKKLPKRGFKLPYEPSFPAGNFTGLRSKPFDQLAGEIYLSSDEPVIGCYFFSKPIFILRDINVIRSILIKDFQNFRNRGFEVDSNLEPIAEHLLLMKGQEWRNLRIKLTPTFTSGKMRTMFPTLIDIGNQLSQVLGREAKEPKSDVKEILGRFTIDVIASVAFGIEVNTMQNPKSDFRKMMDSILEPRLRFQLVNLLLIGFPGLLKLLKLRIFPQDASEFFINLVKDTMDYRKKNGVKRNDFMQLMIQLRETGYVHDADNHEKDESEETQQKFTIEKAAAQAFLFLFAGFETSSATLQYTLYELAMNPEIQTKLQEEINSAKAEGEEFTYDKLMELDFLDRVIAETLRKYPVASVLTRESEKDYDIPGTDLKLLAGDQVWVPIFGLHRNPEYYPDPEKFDPDRFLPERKEAIPASAYIPFGDGPRSCIGNRFALMQTKVGLAAFLAEHSVAKTLDTPKKVEFNPKTGVARPTKTIYLKISKNKKSQ